MHLLPLLDLHGLLYGENQLYLLLMKCDDGHESPFCVHLMKKNDLRLGSATCFCRIGSMMGRHPRLHQRLQLLTGLIWGLETAFFYCRLSSDTQFTEVLWRRSGQRRTYNDAATRVGNSVVNPNLCNCELHAPVRSIRKFGRKVLNSSPSYPYYRHIVNPNFLLFSIHRTQ